MPARKSRRSALPTSSAWETTYKIGEMAIAAPQVIAHRTARMMQAGASPNRRDRQEFLLMGQEKLAAGSEAMLAMAQPLYKMNQELLSIAARQWWQAWTSAVSIPGAFAQQLQNPYPLLLRSLTTAATSRTVQSSLTRAIAQGVAPAHKRVTANAKRLGKLKH